MAVNQDPAVLIKQLKMLPDPALQQFAAAHRGDTNMVSLAIGESNRRKELRANQQAQMAGVKPPPVVDQDIAAIHQPQLPEQQGIGALPTPNVARMADGGIAGYDEGGSTEQDPNSVLAYNNEPVMRMAEGGIAHFRDRGAVQGSPEEYRAYALQRAKAMGLDPMFIDAIFSHESRYNPAAKSPTGPVGIGQLTKATAKAYGLNPAERTDPYKNIDTSLRFMTDLNKKYGGDKTKMAVAYNQGETYLDRHLRENQGQVVPSKLKAEPQNYLTKTVRKIAEGATDLLVPSAMAAETTGKAAPQAQAAPAAEPRAITGNQGLIGTGETALQYLTGLAAIPTAGGAAVLGQLPNVLSGKGMDRAEMEKSFREKAGQVTYEPRTEGGKAVSEGFAKTLEDLKIPPYLAHMGNLSPTRGRAGIPASELEALAAEKTRMAETPRLTGPGVSETMVQGKGELPVRNARAVAQQLADIDEAKAWRDTVLEGKATKGVESTRPEVIARNAELARAQGIAAAASPAATAGTYVQPGQEGISALNVGSDYGEADDRSFGPIDRSGTTPDKDLAAATEKSKESKGKFTDDDLLMLGLGMMANTKPGTGNLLGDLMSSAGTAGIGALQAKREREKTEMDKEYKDILGKYYGSLGKKAEGEAALYASGEKFRMADRQKAAAAIEQEMAKWQQTVGMAAPPGAEARKRQELTNYYFNLFGLDVPDTIGAQATGSGFKVLGSRPS